MRREYKILTVLLFLTLASIPLATKASVEVGVKKGDWIEYQVEVTGHLEEHDAQWARIEVVDVQGPVLNLNVTTQFTNGTYLYENVTLNLVAGQLGDDFFIPASLSPGDTFYDSRMGNVTIEGLEHRTYSGAQRSVVSGQTADTSFYWDKETGVLVEAYSLYPKINFTIKTVADKTNMWEPHPPELITAIITAVITTIAIVVIVAFLVVWRRKASKK